MVESPEVSRASNALLDALVAASIDGMPEDPGELQMSMQELLEEDGYDVNDLDIHVEPDLRHAQAWMVIDHQWVKIIA